ncbi:hypothetical protein HC358_04000 [Wolbachia pipientis]|uniref:Uncharacterized protein n=1 Tax=Wolbachia pipientis TaxID=955 RepID=A0A7G5CAH1_WOLPI|nr:hypothetical protein [Wolbachia pipientis]QMV46205.1 hypothetical protein HC358_04000 [Wolbachia pipientis]
MDCDILPNLFSGKGNSAESSKTVGSNQMNIPAKEATCLDSTSFPRVDNGINTLKQPDTSVELKKLTEVHPSVYSAAKH